MVFYGVRLKILEAEKALLAKGKLKCHDDVFYLYWQEVRQLQKGEMSWLDVEERIRERRIEYIRLSKLPPPKTFGVANRLKTNHNTGDVLSGKGASPGACQGIARVIMDPGTEATVAAGEILVAPYTDPAWTPLFLTASAAVVEVGSYFSHAGTIAREYGMPCVVDVENCTSRIKTGDKIRVDGSQGVVSLISEDKPEQGTEPGEIKC